MDFSKILNKNAIKIIRTILSEKEMYFNEIYEKAGIRSKNNLLKNINTLTELGILKKETRKNSTYYQINFSDNGALAMLTCAEFIKAKEMKNIPYKIINPILKNIENPFAIILITGSYAEKKERKDSDLDLAIILPDKEDKRVIANYLKNNGSLITPEIHPYIFTASEFYLMLINKEENYGKEIFRKRIILSGAEIYYKIIWRAIENGFKG